MARKHAKKPPPAAPLSSDPRTDAQKKLAAAVAGVAPVRPRAAVRPPPTPPTPPRHKPDVRIDRAQIAWGERRFDEAISHYEQALARDPQNAVLLVDVARAYALRYRYGDAERLVERAQSLHPDDAHLQLMLGRSYVQIQQFDRAIVCYRRALELSPASPDRPQTLLELAKMLERLHDLDGARRHAEEALALAPGFEKARYTLAVVERRAGDVARAESRWRELVDTGRAPPGVVADSWYELAALYDAAGWYDEAFDALTRAKGIFTRAADGCRRDAAAIARVAASTFDTITPEHCQRWRDALGDAGIGDPPRRMALLTSHPRSGTTLLEQVLDSHPDAVSADELQVMAEMVYLPLVRKGTPNEPVPHILDRASADDLRQVRQSYRAAMEGALRQPIGERLLVDKNPELTMLLPLVARAFPEMSVVFALRDPRDVVVSCFMQRLPLNPVSVHYLTLEGTARKYAATMGAWLKIRDMLRNPWVEVRYEDTVADIERQARTVLSFLGLPWNEAVLDYHRRAKQKHVHSPTYASVTKPVYASSIGRWRNYAAQLEPCMDVLEPFVRAFGYESSG